MGRLIIAWLLTLTLFKTKTPVASFSPELFAKANCAVAILFTDLRGSTAMYAERGDPRAYRLVRDHSAILADAIDGHNGALVKTIGDAIMATFA